MQCPSCGTLVSEDHRFCAACGEAIPTPSEDVAEALLHDSAPVATRARLHLIRGDGGEGYTFQLNGEEQVAGRTDGPILFPDDPTVSPVHAVFYFDGDRLLVRDAGSRNGTFIRIRESVPIVDGEVFRCGEQVLRFDLWRPIPLSAGEDGAVFCGTPVQPWHFKITQVLGGEAEGMVYCASSRSVTLGREDCDINFNHDRYISHRHTRIQWREGRYMLEDTESRNGTFFRLKREVPLADGDYIFIGRQLLKVELV